MSRAMNALAKKTVTLALTLVWGATAFLPAARAAQTADYQIGGSLDAADVAVEPNPSVKNVDLVFDNKNIEYTHNLSFI